jgi:hypothetical protein
VSVSETVAGRYSPAMARIIIPELRLAARGS